MRISDWSSDVCSSDLAGPEDRSGSRLPQDRRTTVTASLAERRNPLTIKPDPSKAAQACRLLIRAYFHGPDGDEWSDVQDALPVPLRAFHLPETFFETYAGRTQSGTALLPMPSHARRRIQRGKSTYSGPSSPPQSHYHPRLHK